MFSSFTRFLCGVGLLPHLEASAPRKAKAAMTAASAHSPTTESASRPHDRMKIERGEREGEPAMEDILSDTLQRTPPAAASPGLPPVDPVVKVPLSSQAVYAGLPEGASESNPSSPRSTLGAAPGSPSPGDPEEAEPSLYMRQGVAFAAKLNPSPTAVGPCADPSMDGVHAVAPEGLEQGSLFRWSDGGRHADEPLLPFMFEACEHIALDAGKEWNAYPATGRHRSGGGENGAAAAAAAPSSLVVDSRAGDRLPRASKPAAAVPRVPPRVADRPRAEEWADDELLTLPEAAALFWPAGPITTNTLRTAERDGTLTVTKVAGKFFTTPMAIRRMGLDEVGVRTKPETDESGAASAEALFQIKLAEAKRLGRVRPRSKRAAKRPVAPASNGKARQ